MTDILAKIDAATEGLCACGCGQILGANGPSGFWATETCQRRWHLADQPPGTRAGDFQLAFQQWVDGWLHAFAVFAEQVRPLVASMAALAEQVQRAQQCDAEPTDPMERALWLRKHRNTGPTERLRAPRRLGMK